MSIPDRLMDIMSFRVNILFISSFIENFIILVVTTAEKSELVDITTSHVFFYVFSHVFFSSSLVSNPAGRYL